MSTARLKLGQRDFWKRIDKIERQAALGAAVLEGDTPEAREARIQAARADALVFARTYLPHYFTGPSAEFHQDWLDTLVDRTEAALEAVRGGEKKVHSVANICPRGFAKTTVAEFAASLYLLVVLEVPFTVVVFESADQADAVVEALADELEGNALLRADFGDLLESRTPTKKGARVVTSQGCAIQALGMKAKFRGIKFRQHRPYVALVDDPEDDETVRSDAQRRKVRKLITGKLRLALEPGGLLWVNQNIIHPDCLAAHIQTDVRRAQEAREAGSSEAAYPFRGWTVFSYAALNEDGESTWPTRFPTSFLVQLREEDPDQFAMEMMGVLVEGADKPFRRDLVVYFTPLEIQGLDLWKVGALDPSLGRTDRSDFSAFAVLGAFGRAPVAYSLCLDFARRGTEQMLEDWFRLHLVHRPAVWLVEGVGFQSLLKRDFELMCEARGIWPRVDLYEDSTPKDIRIRRVVRPVHRGVLRFRDDQRAALEQVFDFPFGRHDDVPDVLEMAWSRMARHIEASSQLASGGMHMLPRRGGFGRDLGRPDFGTGAW